MDEEAVGNIQATEQNTPLEWHHGSKYENGPSIVENGLRPSGDQPGSRRDGNGRHLFLVHADPQNSNYLVFYCGRSGYEILVTRWPQLMVRRIASGA